MAAKVFVWGRSINPSRPGLLLALLLLPLLAEAADAGLGAAIEKRSDEIKAKLVEVRRDIHMNPELGNREFRTAQVVAGYLKALGLEAKSGVAKTGVVALLKGGRPGPTVAVRADMDALPITELNDVPYKSRNPGVKHACGHDVHTAIVLGVAEVLSSVKDQLPGSVKFIFQPAEEGPPPGEEGGASLMVKEGVLEDPEVSAIFGLHVSPQYDVGTVAYQIGPALASSDRFEIVIHGKKTHAAYPHTGIDPVPIAAQIVLGLQTIVSRQLDAREPVVLSIGIIEGGNRHNIIAEKVRLVGTVRTLAPGLKDEVKRRMHNIIEGVSGSYGARYEFDYSEGTPVTVNDPELAARSLPTLERLLGRDRVVEVKPHMGAEDFAYYAQKVPGFYFFLGVRNEAKGITAMNHTEYFDVDEDAIPLGVKLMSNLVVDYLTRAASTR